MPRSEARLFTSIWDDPDWRALSRGQRDTYVLLLTQPDLTHCGVIPLREGLWAAKAGVPVDEICEDLKGLESVGWVVIDHDSRELFVRSLMRRDKVLRQPKLWIPLAASVKQAFSVRIRAALLAELVRTRAEGGINERVVRGLDDLILLMECQLDTLSGRHRESLSDTDADSQADSEPDTQADSHPHSLQGEGERGKGKNTPSPFPSSPPSPPAEVTPATAPAGVTAEGEGDSLRDSEDPAVDVLVAGIRELRPDWAEKSIRRVLALPEVADREWGAVCRAALAVAADPESQQPGRLARDGPWWYTPPAASAAPEPVPRCGQCSPARRLEDAEGRDLGPCPNCHPASRNGGTP
jgi:hypothetical protein